MEESFGHAGSVFTGLDIPLVVKLHGPAFLTMVQEELDTRFGQEKVRREGEALIQLPVLTSPSRCTLTETIERYGLHPAFAAHVVNPMPALDDLPLWDVSSCDRNTILYVGRFDMIKGADVLIRAFRRLRRSHPHVRLVFVGPDGGLVQRGRAPVHLPEFIASLGDPTLASFVSYRGKLPPDAIKALRAQSLLTVVPSRRETQSYAALEAMLQRCPVVCTNTSGLSEIIEHGVTGLKAHPEDPDDLAAQMARIIDDPELGRSLGHAAREYVLAQHAPAKVAAQTIDVYRRAIELHQARRSGRR